MGNILTLLGLVCIGAGTCLGMFEERKNSTNKTVKKEETVKMVDPVKVNDDPVKQIIG